MSCRNILLTLSFPTPPSQLHCCLLFVSCRYQPGPSLVGAFSVIVKSSRRLFGSSSIPRDWDHGKGARLGVLAMCPVQGWDWAAHCHCPRLLLLSCWCWAGGRRGSGGEISSDQPPAARSTVSIASLDTHSYPHIQCPGVLINPRTLVPTFSILFWEVLASFLVTPDV